MSDRVSFPGASGDLLAARIERPAGEPAAWALFAHCFTCSKDLQAAREVTRTLAERGFAVLRFDFTGLGESEGDFAETDFSSNVEDLVAAADWLRAEHGPPRLLVGHSLGGAAVLVAAGLIEETAAVVTIGAPAETEHLRETLLKEAPELEGTEEAELELAGRPFRIKRRLLERAVEEDPEPHRFEQWLLNSALAIDADLESAGAARAMARNIFEEWQMFHRLDNFREWLDAGAPSQDAWDTTTERHKDDMEERSSGSG